MAFIAHIPVAWIPAIPAGKTVSALSGTFLLIMKNFTKTAHIKSRTALA
ncbi:MAG: hypothetical protein WAW61_10335 [Methylococcaceae bacterium]